MEDCSIFDWSYCQSNLQLSNPSRAILTRKSSTIFVDTNAGARSELSKTQTRNLDLVFLCTAIQENLKLCRNRSVTKSNHWRGVTGELTHSSSLMSFLNTATQRGIQNLMKLRIYMTFSWTTPRCISQHIWKLSRKTNKIWAQTMSWCSIVMSSHGI